MARIRRPLTGEPTRQPAAIGSASIVLPAFLEQGLASGHPWVYRNHVPAGFEAPTGSWVFVHAGRASAWGLWDSDSQIALRIYARDSQPSATSIAARVERAFRLRQLHNPPETTAFRLINGEGDGLPGIIVDVYGEYAVIATYSRATYPLLPWLLDAFASYSFAGVLHKRVAGESQTETNIDVLSGQGPPNNLVVLERGMRVYADLLSGHKTGLYLDQRDNRKTFAGFAAKNSVLNLFSYTGGFSLAAALAGCTTTNVDISQPALDRARENFELNGLHSSEHAFTRMDCHEYLSNAAADIGRFDAIVCDPPSLARNRTQLEQALKAYLRLNTLGLRLLRDGGLYAAASCTAQVSPEAFRQMLIQAVGRAHRTAQIIHEAGHAFDHPIAIGHPEGRYLKFVMLRVFDV